MPPKIPVQALDAAQQKEAAQHLTKTTNTLILDYLLWLSAKTVLHEARGHHLRQPRPVSKGRRLVGLVDGLILSFEHSAQPRLPSQKLTERLHLSALVILYVYRDAYRLSRGTRETHERRREITRHRTRQYLNARRVEHCLSGLASPAQAARFSSEPSHCPRAIRQEAATLFGLNPELDLTHKDLAGKPPMLFEALEGFMMVSAEQFRSQRTTPAAMWTDMASDFMLFACLEAYLVYGATGMGMLNACFAWGRNGETGSDALNGLLKPRSIQVPHFALLEQGQAARLALLVANLPLEGASPSDPVLLEHMLEIAKEKLYPDFRDQVLSYLHAVLSSMSEPDLSAYGAASAENNIQAPILSKSVLTAPGEILISHDREAEDRHADLEREPRMTATQAEQNMGAYYGQHGKKRDAPAGGAESNKKTRVYV
ncbi:hypothetical protein BCR37DRAFT_378455 [Protomyces lactucae-debilis]|uniref:Uncharacterized protein n=1 Tax=Protomyces lactucae-debilis TaxID=2754530 RepID=A0A1Y2FKD0_PROLT|nr:uncharacterized protein BCR37DRAFT_378455 [Protomyces lactucae-debilis]ORY84433.1 hypothetical protein BCR37DRAFT_378455 [Protomyces lactucae-debilis]